MRLYSAILHAQDRLGDSADQGSLDGQSLEEAIERYDQRMRQIAAEQGLDPNQWFAHVEHVARARIGRETFEYVGNVNKIHAALRTVRFQRDARERVLGTTPP